MIATLNPEKAALLCEWREQCRIHLLELEKKSIFVRVSVFEKIINEKTIQVNRMLCINTDSNQIQPYKHYTDSYQQCKFIENWNGLNTNQMRSLPKSLQEYENRAKNWLNGRRAINYAQNLFPEMILCAEHYATSTANKVFGNNNNSCDKCKKDLYASILLHSYISGICCGRVALYDGHHRASLICENSIKKEGNLKRLLQKYFDGEQMQYSFPKHLQDAIDYFKNKYHEKLNQYQTRYVHRITTTTTSTSSGCNYTHSRGGPHIGSCKKYRNNPLNNNNNNNCERKCMDNVLPPINIFNDDNYVSNNRQNNGRICIQNTCNISASNIKTNDIDCNLMVKMNDMQCRNSYLEQEIAQYRERQRLDAEKIKLLEEQIALLQRQSMESSIDSVVNTVNTSTHSPLDTHTNINNMNNVPLYYNNICEGVFPLSPLSLNMNESSINSYNFPTNLCNRASFGAMNPSLCGFELDTNSFNSL